MANRRARRFHRQDDIARECWSCGSERRDRFGFTSGGRQRFRCKVCGRTFVNAEAIPGSRFSAEEMERALNGFYSGHFARLARRARHLYPWDTPERTPHMSTIHRWIARYTEEAVGLLGKVPVHAGWKWVVEESALETNSGSRRSLWFWDVIDHDTHFLLASLLCPMRTIGNARTLMAQAMLRASGALPWVIVTANLGRYLEGALWAFRQGRGSPPSRPISIVDGREYWPAHDQPAVARAAVMHVPRSKQSAMLLMKGWEIHYNHFRPHWDLDLATPAKAIGASTSAKSWADVISART